MVMEKSIKCTYLLVGIAREKSLQLFCFFVVGYIQRQRIRLSSMLVKESKGSG